MCILSSLILNILCLYNEKKLYISKFNAFHQTYNRDTNFFLQIRFKWRIKFDTISSIFFFETKSKLFTYYFLILKVRRFHRAFELYSTYNNMSFRTWT